MQETQNGPTSGETDISYDVHGREVIRHENKVPSLINRLID